jgi:valyl-tRNA synthetase
MCKTRLYQGEGPEYAAARDVVSTLLLAVLKLFAPFLPFVTEEIYLALFAAGEGCASIHTSHWPEVQPGWIDPEAEATGAALVHIATCVRRYKSERNIGLGAELDGLQLAAGDPSLHSALQAARLDLQSVTRAREIEYQENSLVTPTNALRIAISYMGKIEIL